MSFRHRLILLLTSACGAFVLLCPVGGNSPTAKLGPIVSAAPPLDADSAGPGLEDPVMNALRREANLALGQLRARETQ
jgi:hypothetical protein